MNKILFKAYAVVRFFFFAMFFGSTSEKNTQELLKPIMM